MKKIFLVMTVMFTIFTGVLFSACGDAYKKLKINFESETSYVRLILDEEYKTLYPEANAKEKANSQLVHFSISGIKAKDLGRVSAQIIPADLARMGEMVVEGTDIYFYVSATRSGNGSIVLTHMGSGKQKSVPLYVDRKGTTASSKGNSLIVDIPDENILTEEEKAEMTEEEITQAQLVEKIVNIDADSLLNFQPLDTTDIVRWEVVDKDLNKTDLTIEGVQVGDFTEATDDQDKDNSLLKAVSQIKISSKCAGGTFYLQPVLTMEGYDELVQDFAITVNLVKVLNENNIDVLTNGIATSSHEDTLTRVEGSKIIDGDLVLLTNHGSYNSADVRLFFKDTNIFESETYKNIYDYEITSSSSQIEVLSEADHYYTFVGLKYNANLQLIKFNFEPKKAVGDIKPFSVNIGVSLSEVAENISVKVDNVLTETEYIDDNSQEVEVQLFDYYSKYSNYGEKFNFEVQKTSTDLSLKEMQISINKNILSKKNLSSVENDNIYNLEFRKGSRYLQFSETNGDLLISESFRYTDNIYVKYLTDNTKTSNDGLSFAISNIYNDMYGEGAIENTSKTLNIKITRGKGVTGLDLTGSLVSNDPVMSVTGSGISFRTTTNTDFYIFNQDVKKQEEIFKNQTNGATVLTDKFIFNDNISIVYGASISDFKGADSSSMQLDDIAELKFKYEILKGGQPVDIFDIYMFSQSQSGFELLGQESFKVNIQQQAGSGGGGYELPFNSLCILRKDGEEINDGEYTLKISQLGTNYTKTFDFNVVSKLRTDNLLVSPFTAEEATKLSGVYYNYDGYKEDSFILPTDKELSTEIKIGNAESGSFVENSELYQYVTKVSVNQQIVDSNLEAVVGFDAKEYISYSADTLESKCFTGKLKTGINGTYLNNQNHYIQITFVVEYKEYDKDDNWFVVLKNTNSKLKKSFNVFIYVPLGEAYFNDKMTSTQAYYYEDLGYYYKHLATKTFKLNIPNPNELSSQSMFDYLTVEWQSNHESLAGHDFESTDNTATVTFKKVQNSYAIVSAKVSQFNIERTVSCYVHLLQPTNTEKLVIRNNLKTINDTKYINLKLNSSLKLDVDILGDTGFNEIKYVVVDSVGNSYSSYKVDSNGQLLNVFDSAGNPILDLEQQKFAKVAKDFKVIIFAKDWLSKDVDSSYNSYDLTDLTEYLIHPSFLDEVLIIDIKIRDGSQNMPFIVSNAQEFRDLANNTELYYYELVNDINMANTAVNLGEFKGNLNSYKDYVLLTEKPADWDTNFNNYYEYKSGKYQKLENQQSFAYRKFYSLRQLHFTVYNAKLADSNINASYNATNKYNETLPTNVSNYALFDVVSEQAVISNISFVINIGEIDLVNENIANFGLVGENKGTINNVAVEYTGEITVKFETTGKALNIGAMAGKNTGVINQLDTTYVYSMGDLKVIGDNKTKIYLGGLVGLNEGTITGTLPSNNSNGVEYALYYEEQGSLFDGEISLTNVVLSNLSSGVWQNNSALGGIVGWNTGKIINAYSSGSLQGESVVGGIVGYNQGSGNTITTATESSANILNSLSTTKVKGSNYIGGVVAVDNCGVLYHAYYEVYNTYTTKEGGISVEGNNYVGGVIGYALNSKLQYCYFHSFRWTYDCNEGDIFEESEFYYDYNGERVQKLPDIFGKQYVGGIIGYANNSNQDKTDNSDEGKKIRVVVEKCQVDAFISGNVDINDDNYTASLVGYSYNVPYIQYGIVQGAVIYNTGNSSNGYRNLRIFEGGTEITDTVYSDAMAEIYKTMFSENTADAYVPLIDNIATVSDVFGIDGRPFIYLDKDNNIKLITEAPTDIDFGGSMSVDKINGSMTFTDSNGTTASESKTIILYYYDLVNSNSNNYANDKKTINTIKLDDFINRKLVQVTPDIGVRLKVVSSNTSVISVQTNGSIVLNKEGEVVLRFSSVINPNVYDEIRVIVRSMPTTYEIYKNSTFVESNKLDGQILNIIKDTSKYIYENYTGSITVNNTEYDYKLTSNVRVELTANAKDGADITKLTINDDKINGTLAIDNKEPILISSSEETGKYEITLQSFVTFEMNGKTYLVKIKNNAQQFTIDTKKGATAINLDVTDAVLSVADSMNLGLNIETDTTINSVDVAIDIKYQDGTNAKVVDNAGNEINKYELLQFNIDKLNKSKGVLTLSSSVVELTQTQSESFEIKINENAKIEKDLYLTITFSTQDKSCVLNMVILPQRITSILANNYKKDTDNSWDNSSIVRPGVANAIVIDVSPETAYFEYLEITDTFSQEKLTFLQMDSFSATNGLEGSKALPYYVSSDGYGIKLIKQADTKRIYVYALLSQMAEVNAQHIIKITAYSSSGYILGQTELKLESAVFPTVMLSYYDAKDKICAESDSRLLNNNNTADLAYGVEAKLSARTISTEGEIEWLIDTTISTNKEDFLKTLSIVEKGGYYYLKTNYIDDYADNILGKTITVTAKVSKTTNGHLEESQTSIIFTIRKFTVNGVSFKSDIATSGNRIAGVIGRESELEFYFNETDVSFYNDGYWNKNYYQGSTTDIEKLLTNINSFNDGLTLELVSSNETIDLTAGIKGISETNQIYEVYNASGTKLAEFKRSDTGKLLLVPASTNLNNYQFKISLNISFNNTNNSTDNIPQLVADEKNADAIIVTYYRINISQVSTRYNYRPVANAQEFMDMVEGNYYILVDDIILTEYEMLDLKLGGFDGNGYTITIRSFAYSTMASESSGGIGYFGLFKQIYKGEIVENLIVKYDIGVVDLCEYEVAEGEYYQTIYFAGIAPINEGFVTNCNVVGELNIRASQVAPSSFFVAGIANDNNSTGYITNTTSNVTILAGGIVAGFVSNNLGKIATSQFNGTIQAYSSSSLSNAIKTAGFVVDNSGQISLSFVHNLNGNNVSIESAGSIGGFVFQNSGTIFDCYLSQVSFTSRGEVGGFVHSSTGSIKRCYVNSTDSLQGDRSKDAFVFTKPSGSYENCYYILDVVIASSISGISCITKLDVSNENSYKNFVFSGDDYGVWKMTNSGPILSPAYTLTGHKTSSTIVEDGEEKMVFYVPGTKDIPYVIYDYITFQDYMSITAIEGVLNGHFRIVADIDLTKIKDNPKSSSYTFSGSLEGNNMIISAFGLYSTSEISSIGLFKEIKQTSMKSSYVNNLVLKPVGIRASNSNTVGVLAGIIDSGYIYNVTIDKESLVVLGKNAVGGLAGIIKGSFNINGISSNVGANAIFRQTVSSKTNIYVGKFNSGSADYTNINSVSYAGAIAGIVDAYDYRVSPNISNGSYYKIKNCNVLGRVVIVGETIGGAFGLVTERSMATNIKFNARDESYLKGVYYSGGVVGENRGVLKDANLTMSLEKETLFDANLTGEFSNVIGGIVAVNYGGLIYNPVVQAHVINYNSLSTSGGICGRNSYGTIVNPTFNGVVYGLFAGAIAGTDYTFDTLNNTGNSVGVVTDATKISLPTEYQSYSALRFDNSAEILPKHYQAINFDMIKTWYNTQKTAFEGKYNPVGTFYSYSTNEIVEDVKINYSKALGAVVAMTDKYFNYTLTNNTLDLTVTDEQWVDLVKLTDTANMTIGKYFVEDPNGEYTNGQKTYKLVSIQDVPNIDSSETYYRLNRTNLKPNMKDNLTEEGEVYNDLQAIIRDGKSPDCFFLVAVRTSAYDFWNVNSGYTDLTYVYIYDN